MKIKHPKLYWTPSKGYAARPSEFGVDFVILHYTYGTYPGDLNYLTRSPRPACPSCHFYIRKNGDVHAQVRLENMAFHAGISWSRPYTWQHKRWSALRPNERSIGIEIESHGDYTEEQYKALEFLLPVLALRYAIPYETMPDPWRGCDPSVSKKHGGDAYEIDDLKNFRGFLAHGNIHYSKTDPGLNFDWDRIKAFGPVPDPGCPTLPQLTIWKDDPRVIRKEGMVYV